MKLSKHFLNFFIFLKFSWKYFVIIGIPLILLPLAISGNKAFQCAYVIGIVSVFWITEVMDLAVTSLIPVVLFPIFGILTPSKVAACYMKDICFMLIGGIIVAKTFEKQNLHKRFGLRILKLMGPNPIFQYMGFMLSTWFLSMWISNTASTVMMITLAEPFVQQWTTTSSDKIEKNSTANSTELTKLKIEDEVKIEKNELSKTPTERIPGITKGLFLSIAYSATCGGIATLSGTAPNLVFYGFMEEQYGSNLNLNFGTFMLFSLPLSLIILSFLWFIVCARYIGLSAIFKKKIDILRKRKTINFIDKELANLGSISFGEISALIIFILMILLWILREPGVPLLGALFTYKNSKGELVKYWTDSISAILAALLVFNLPAKNPFKNKNNNEKLMDWKYIEKRFPWGLLFLFGGGFALATGCEESGLSLIIGNILTSLKDLPQFVILLIISLSVSFLTEITSNTATVTILLPIMLHMAECIGIHPMIMGLTVTITSSFSFCLPAATPPNAVLFSTGKIRVIDMVSTGLILNFLSVLLLTVMAYYYSVPIFHTSVVPDWFMKNCSEIKNITYQA